MDNLTLLSDTLKITEINIFIGGSNNFINEPMHKKAAGISTVCTR